MKTPADPVEPSAGGAGRSRGAFDRISSVLAWILLLAIGAVTLFVLWLVLRELTSLVIGSVVVIVQVWFFFRFRELRQEVDRLREAVARREREAPPEEAHKSGSVEATYR